MSLEQPPWLRNFHGQIPTRTIVVSPTVVVQGTPARTNRIDVRVKGAEGERQVARELNQVIQSLLVKHDIPIPVQAVVQRNQNQTAVGGCDLTGCFGIAIEVKRQETLYVNAWWKQCTEQASRNKEFPVLLYRRNKEQWKAVMNVWLQMPGSAAIQVRAEVDWQSFLTWFREWVDRKLEQGELPET